jgi:NAD(P)-dependent dehydrogenase (short-subunit alcohol dehydrogenase family)
MTGDDHNPTGRVWLITGASRGLGREFAQAALEAGDTVVLTARDPSDSSRWPIAIPTPRSRSSST